MSPQNFFSIFSKNFDFFEKIVTLKNIQNLISLKKVNIHFRRRTPPFQKRRYLPFFQKITAFLKKTTK